MSSETSECCRSRHFFCTSTNQSICQEMGIPDVKICQDGQGVDSGLKCSQNLQIARQKLCFGCRDKQECVSMSHPNLIPSMPWWVYFAVFFTFFHCLSIFAFQCFPYSFRKKFRYVRGIQLRFPEIFPPNFCGPPVMSGLISPQSLLRFISAINHSLVHQLQQI